jgi:cytochrome bd-type quinol oxidase subunit 2
MNIVRFWTLALILTAYAVPDGYDLGAGGLHLWLARGNQERRILLNTTGPVWKGNEVWLIAAGRMMVVSCPKVYAAGFSGFYLALTVLWLLILRHFLRISRPDRSRARTQLLGTFTLLLNPFSILAGLLSLAVLAWHGTNYLRVKTERDH